MRTSINFINNLVFQFIPESRGFGFKRFLLRMAGAVVGRNVKLSSSLKVYGCGDIVIGDNTWVGYQTMIVSSSRVEIGANVDIAPRVYIGTGTHNIDITSDRVAAADISRDVSVGDGSWLCANATILPGVELGPKTVVAAGSVVTKSFKEGYAMVAGVPAKKVKDLRLDS